MFKIKSSFVVQHQDKNTIHVDRYVSAFNNKKPQ